MRRVFAAIALFGLTGCGSCVEEKAPEQPPQLTKPHMIVKTTDGGLKKPFYLGKGPRFAEILIDASPPNDGGGSAPAPAPSAP